MEVPEDKQNVLHVIQEEEEEEEEFDTIDISSSMEDIQDFPELNTIDDVLSDMGMKCSEKKQENKYSSNDEPMIVTFYDEETKDTYVRQYHIGLSTGEDETQHVYRAEKKSPSEDLFLAVKIIPNPNLKLLMKLDQEIERSGNVPEDINISGLSRIPFKDNGNTNYLVFPHMNYGSLRYIMQKTEIRYGIPEVSIVAILKETLKGLSLIHENDEVHKEINAGHIFMKDKAQIKLAFSVTVFEEDGILNKPSTSSALSMISICKWAAAPEIYDNPDNEYTPKSDIWMIGVTALELAYGGGFRVGNRADFESLVNIIREKNRLPMKVKGSSESHKRIFTKSFGKMIASCLALEPGERPSAAELLQNIIFLKSDAHDFEVWCNKILKNVRLKM